MVAAAFRRRGPGGPRPRQLEGRNRRRGREQYDETHRCDLRGSRGHSCARSAAELCGQAALDAYFALALARAGPLRVCVVNRTCAKGEPVVNRTTERIRALGCPGNPFFWEPETLRDVTKGSTRPDPLHYIAMYMYTPRPAGRGYSVRAAASAARHHKAPDARSATSRG